MGATRGVTDTAAPKPESQVRKYKPVSVHDREFVEFHRDHPEVYQQLVRLAKAWKAAGHDRCGVAMLFERLRWEYGVTTGESPALDNTHRSRYARLIAARHPDLADMFVTRDADVDLAWILTQLYGPAQPSLLEEGAA